MHLPVIFIWLSAFLAIAVAQSGPTSTTSSKAASTDGPNSTPDSTTTSHSFSPGVTLAPGATCDPASTYALGHSCDGSNGTPTISVNPSIVEGISCDPKTRKAHVTLSTSTTAPHSPIVAAQIATTSSSVNAAPTAIGGIAMVEVVAALWVVVFVA